MSRKYEPLNLLELYIKGDTKGWNEFLTTCNINGDINTLAKTRYQLQAGMDDLKTQKLNTDKIILWFIRLQNSLEITMKKILRRKNPNPCDHPLLALDQIEHKEKKNERDNDFELYLRKSSY